MSRAASITKARAKGFDASRKTFYGKNAALVLLKTDGSAKAYTELERLTFAWDIKRPSRTDRIVVKVAVTDAGFNANVEDATHFVAVDTTNDALNRRLFEINRDTDPPQVSAFWEIVGNPTGRRYTP